MATEKVRIKEIKDEEVIFTNGYGFVVVTIAVAVSGTILTALTCGSVMSAPTRASRLESLSKSSNSTDSSA